VRNNAIGRKLCLLAVTLAVSLVTVSPTVAAPVCAISNITPLEFDAPYNPANRRPTDGRTSFTVTCSSPTTTTLSLLYDHRLTGVSDAVLHYDLSATPDRMTVWGNGSDGVTVTRSFSAGTPTTVYVYARIPPRQKAAPGRYNDSLLVVTWS
jgi:spore coat protein U-like protein